MGAFIAGVSSILTGLNFIVSIHKLRAPGLSWSRLPLFLWALYATSIIQVLATPVLAITLLLLILERVAQIGIFDPALGGDPVLFQHFFWFYSHPAVYIMILPAMGVISEVITVFSRKPIFGYKAIAYSSFGIALIAFLVWGHHLFVSGQSELANFVFSLLTMFVAVPTGVKVFSWVGTMYRGKIHFHAPMLYAFGFLELFTIGGLTGVFLATLSIDVHLTDTYFVIAHFHYVMVGGTLMGFLAAMHYWFPKMTGRMYPEKPAMIAFIFIILGFNVTFFPQFILGAQGMPRRYWDYLPEFTLLNQVSTVGSWLIGVGFIYTAWYLGRACFKGPKAPGNPWNALTLDWQTPSPPPHENFLVIPTVTTWPYEYRPDDAGIPTVNPSKA
jgi:cytochrome c oxidase subunit 1